MVLKMAAHGKRRVPAKLLVWCAALMLPIGLIFAWLTLDVDFRSRLASALIGQNAPQGAFEHRVRSYLLEHPEVIMEAINRLEARQREDGETQAQAILESHADEIFRDPDSPVGGNPGGDVTLVEFFDYNCPYCRQMVPVMVEAQKIDPKLRIVYKEFPILGPNSLFAAKAALAARKQGKYVALHEALFQIRGTANADRVMEVAAKAGLDIARLTADMADPAIQALLEKNLALAQALRIDGTPGFVAGKRILRGATDLNGLQLLIGEARAGR